MIEMKKESKNLLIKDTEVDAIIDLISKAHHPSVPGLYVLNAVQILSNLKEVKESKKPCQKSQTS